MPRGLLIVLWLWSTSRLSKNPLDFPWVRRRSRREKQRREIRNLVVVLAAVPTARLCTLPLLCCVNQSSFSCRWQKTHCKLAWAQREIFSLLDWDVQAWLHSGSASHNDFVFVLPSLSDKLSTWKDRTELALDMRHESPYLSRPVERELLFLVASTWSPGIVSHPWTVTLASSAGMPWLARARSCAHP